VAVARGGRTSATDSQCPRAPSFSRTAHGAAALADDDVHVAVAVEVAEGRAAVDVRLGEPRSRAVGSTRSKRGPARSNSSGVWR
jgi:hypothetical protein